MGGRWTAARQAALEGSRIAVTEQLVRAMAEARSRLRVFISGSAVAYYGDRTDELLTEAFSAADDFLASLCRRWECAAQEADRLGARVVLLRTGSRQPSFVVEAPLSPRAWRGPTPCSAWSISSRASITCSTSSPCCLVTGWKRIVLPMSAFTHTGR